MRYLLDTNVISELVAKKPNPMVVDWVNNLEPRSAYLSVVTIGEIRKGIEKVSDPTRKAVLEAWLADDLIPRFDRRILALGLDEMLEWGEMAGQAELAGRTLSAMDSLIAALARRYGCVIGTRNVGHFTGLGVSVFNPWAD